MRESRSRSGGWVPPPVRYPTEWQPSAEIQPDGTYRCRVLRKVTEATPERRDVCGGKHRHRWQAHVCAIEEAYRLNHPKERRSA